MKKFWKRYALLVQPAIPRKVMLVMRMSFFIMFALLLNVSATGLAQDVVVKKKQMSYEQLFDLIQQQTGLSTFSSGNVINLSDQISVDITTYTLEDLLTKVTETSGLTYDLIDDFIVIRPKKPEEIIQSRYEAQEEIKTIQGCVVDDKGEPLIGVSVVIDGTLIGQPTGLDGTFSLPFTQGMTLKVSFIGMKTQIIKVSSPDYLRVVLLDEGTDLNEVIVVAYGTTTKGTYNGSSVKVDNEVINRAPVASPIQAIQGSASGVRITQSSGQPGSGMNVQIRGIGSINGNTQPLYVIDGIPVENKNLSSQESSDPMALINPSDIESMTVLKDAAATSLYGSRAANGVVIITTKSGKQGDLQFNVNVAAGISDYAIPGQKKPYMDAPELANYMYGAFYNRLLYDNGYMDKWDYNTNAFYESNLVLSEDVARDYHLQALKNIYYKGHLYHPNDPQDGSFSYGGLSTSQWEQMLSPHHYSWADEVLKIGKTYKFDLSAQGGNEKQNFYASLGYYNQEGIIDGSGYERFTGKLNVSFKVNKRLNITLSENLSYGIKEGRSSGALYRSNPIYALQYLNPSAAITVNGHYNENVAYNTSYPNPLIELDYVSATNYQARSITNGVLAYDIAKGLKFQSTNAFDITFADDYNINKKESISAPQNGMVERSMINAKKLTTSNILTYQKMIKKHSLSLLGGYELSRSKTNFLGGVATDYTHNDLLYLSNAAKIESLSEGVNEDNLISYISKFDYNYKNKYYLGASIRRDGSSRLSPSNRWGNFYSVSAGWIISSERFLQKEWLDFAKVKFSYGTTGNLPVELFEYQNFYDASEVYNSNTTLRLSTLGNENLTWEYSKTYNLGLTSRLFNRYDINVEVYHKETEGLLNYRNISETNGFASVLLNDGTLTNIGFDLDLGVDIIAHKELKWHLDWNISHMKATVSELDEDLIDNPYIYQEGADLYSYYLRKFAGVDPDNGLPTWYDADGNVTYNFNEAPRQVVGKAYPDFFGGITNTINYKNFELSCLFTYSIGAKLFDPMSANQAGNAIGTYNIYHEYKNGIWHQPGDNAERPRVIYTSSINPDYSNAMTSASLLNGDYLRLKNLRIQYNFNKAFCEKLNIKGASVYFTGSDLWTLYGYKHLNPEVGNNGRLHSPEYFPLLKTLQLGVNLKL